MYSTELGWNKTGKKKKEVGPETETVKMKAKT
jgi:hypothetical protein